PRVPRCARAGGGAAHRAGRRRPAAGTAALPAAAPAGPPAHRRPQRLPGPLAGRARAGPGLAAQPGVRGTRRKPIPAVLAGAGRHGLRGGLAAALPAGGGGGMKRLDAEIAVVGAGPAGQAMALALAASGYGVAL